MLRRLAALASIILCCATALAQSRAVKSAKSSATTSSAPRNPFVPGERLKYDVSWADFIVAGELTIETDQKRTFSDVEGYHVTAQARSVGLVSLLNLKVNDIYESYVDGATLQPFRAEKRSRHGKKQSQSSITIDQKRRVITAASGRTLQTPSETYDLAGLIFAMRGMDLTIGKTQTFTIVEDEKLYTINVRPEAKEKISTRAGSFDAIRLASSMSKGRENDKLYNLKMYITNDARRLPVLITAEPSWGAVRVELTSLTGSKKD